tara:strand:- start:521 stop:799 length:279 start_codon:yes stop_codon:yes gene_type:complete
MEDGMMYALAVKELLKEKNIKERFNIRNDDLDNINWLENNKGIITKQQILNKYEEMKIIEDAKPINILKKSGNQKLKDLGLTDDEIAAITGQ